MKRKLLKDLRDKWIASLGSKYGYSHEKNIEHVNKSVEILEGIYKLYLESDQSDPKFESQIINGNGKQYEQALSEMLFWDVLKRNSFDLMPNSGIGPDFHAEKFKYSIFFEVVTPEVDGEGIIERHNNDINTRIYAGAKRTYEQDVEIFLRMTSVLKSKQHKFQEDKRKGIIPEDSICVVVINDALLCPDDLSMLGVSHSADWGAAPFVARATLDGNANLKNKNSKKILTNGFMTEELSHVSALIQVTLRDDYGYAKHLINVESEEFCRLSGWVKDFDIVINENARIKLPDLEFKMNYWSLDAGENITVRKVKCKPSDQEITKYINIQRQSLGLDKIPLD